MVAGRRPTWPAGEGLRRPQRGVLGLGRGPPWPRLALAGQAAGSSGAATEHRQASVAGSGSFVDGEHYSVARPGGRERPAAASSGVAGSGRGRPEQEEQRRRWSSSSCLPWRARQRRERERRVSERELGPGVGRKDARRTRWGRAHGWLPRIGHAASKHYGRSAIAVVPAFKI
jgi:hypothetical protein